MKKTVYPFLLLLVCIVQINCSQAPAKHKFIKHSHGLIVEPELKKLVDEVNGYLQVYDTLSQFTEYDINSLHIPTKYLDSAMKTNTSELKGKVNGGVPIDYYQRKILDDLYAILNSKEVIKYKLDDILNTKYILIARSHDDRLYCLSFAENTGGSYQSAISIIQYRSTDGHVYNYSPGNDSSIFRSDGYGTIYDIKTRAGTKYLLLGSVATCTTCITTYIQLVNFKKGTMASDFSYSLSTRMKDESDETIQYDDKNQRININYTTDDLTPECSCEDFDKIEQQRADSGVIYEYDKTDYGKNCSCIYKFNGDTFVEMEKNIQHE